VITDIFGHELNKGDWIVYSPIDPDGLVGRGLRHGQIASVSTGLFHQLGGSAIIYIEGHEHFTQADRCMKFSLEEATMRKLESGSEPTSKQNT